VPAAVPTRVLGVHDAADALHVDADVDLHARLPPSR